MAANLTAKQVRAIEALLTESTVAGAAAKAGVAAATVYRWLNNSTFDQAYKAARTRLLENSLTRLQGCSARAVDALDQIVTDKFEKPSARVSAARAVLEFALKGREQLELADRLAAIEEALLIGKKAT